jgi:hypothetical protein
MTPPGDAATIAVRGPGDSFGAIGRNVEETLALCADLAADTQPAQSS